MRITVLGKSPSWQDAGGACSGYLVEGDGTTLLVDCGNGVFGKLRERRDYTRVDAIVVSHMHADHCLDLMPYAYALTYSTRQQPVPVGGHPGTQHPARPLLVVPRGGGAALRALSGLWGAPELCAQAFDLREYDPGDELELGTLRVGLATVPHYIPTCAVGVTPRAGGGRFVFGADCSPNDAVVAFADRCELLMLEATLPRPERDGVRGHLTAEEAGEHARAAGAERLVLTHRSDELDAGEGLTRARTAFGGQVELAAEGAEYDV